MHWLAFVFLVIKAFGDIVGNLNDIIDGKYDSIIGQMIGTLLNAFAWWYILSYILGG